jgi:hypothetical protein
VAVVPLIIIQVDLAEALHQTIMVLAICKAVPEVDIAAEAA